MALKLTLKGSFVQILVLDNELWLDIPSLSPEPCCLEVGGDAPPSGFLMWRDFSENILLLCGSPPEFSEAHRWLNPHAAVNHYMEHFLRNLKNRKANTLSASNQKPILSEKPAPVPVRLKTCPFTEIILAVYLQRPPRNRRPPRLSHFLMS